MKNKFIFLLAIIFFISMASASLGTFDDGSCVDIKTILNATTVNLSTISYPNGTVAVSNKIMSKNGKTFNYTFCYTQEVGGYIYDYFDDSGNTFVNSFEITRTGKTLTSQKTTGYIILFIFLLIIFSSFIILGLYLPSSNRKDSIGKIASINNIKYMKYLFLWIAYLISVIISYSLWIFSFAYLDFEYLTNFLRAIFIIQTILILPSFIMYLFITIYNLVRDNKIKEFLMRGLEVDF